ncbi:MAG: glycosyltransferase family 4 protein [Acidimicrobiales bacterium]|nr:glycosyltransferase family 4 protein [Acidimicrobiales bacterium]
MSARLHVCHVIHGLAPGGAEELLVELARVGPGRGLDVSFLSLMTPGASRVATEIRAAGAPLESLGLRTRWDPSALWRGPTVVAGLRPDVIHTHLKHADLVGAAAARRLNIPMVSTLHRIENVGSPVEKLKQWLGGQARVRTAARTITVSDAQRAWYLDAFAADPSVVVTVRNGIASPPPPHPAIRRAVREELGVADGELLAVMLAVMRPAKGHEQLLEAVQLVPNEAAVCLVMAGEGPLEPAVRDAASRSGCHVVLPGWVSDVDRLLSGADLIVHPSLADALPTALIHGLAAGIPAVATDVGGIPEIVTPDTGILVPPDDPGALARAISELARDPARRLTMGQAARRRFEREFSVETWVDHLSAVYREVLGR